MYLIAHDVFMGKWSDDIHAEWTRNLINDGREKSKVLRTKKLMDDNFPDALVRNYRTVVKNLSLPDQGDRHVLAVAIKSDAKFIVTENLKHFPKKYLPENIKAISADDFLFHLSEQKPLQVLGAVKAHRTSLKNPPFEIPEYIQARKNQGLKAFALFLMEHSVAL